MFETFCETSPLHGLSWNQFCAMDAEDKTALLRMIAMCCEQSFRRGFQQGWDSKERGDQVCDLIRWRFSTSLSVSPSPHGTYHDTSLHRLKSECKLHQVGLPQMEESWLSQDDIDSWIVPLFPSLRRKSGVRKSVRFAVLKRDGFRCVYCGADASEQKLHVDHVKPKSLGGSDDIDNLVTACQPCNLGKSNKHADISCGATDGTAQG